MMQASQGGLVVRCAFLLATVQKRKDRRRGGFRADVGLLVWPEEQATLSSVGTGGRAEERKRGRGEDRLLVNTCMDVVRVFPVWMLKRGRDLLLLDRNRCLRCWLCVLMCPGNRRLNFFQDR